MPAKSKAQSQAAGAAYAAKEGKKPASSLKGAAKEMFNTMSVKELKHLAETPRKGLPKKKGG